MPAKREGAQLTLDEDGRILPTDFPDELKISTT